MKNNTTLKQLPCPCDSGNTYQQCCELWQKGEKRLHAPDALTLMRSRYSAYVYKLFDYLLDTWHPATRPETLDEDSLPSQWIGLKIHAYEQQTTEHASVEFTARYKINGKAYRMHERSQFEKINDIWFYKNGVVD